MTDTAREARGEQVIHPAGTDIPPDGYHSPEPPLEPLRTQKNANLQAASLAYRTATVVNICGEAVDIGDQPDYRQNYLRRLSTVRTSPLKAVKLMCFQCSGYSSDEQRKCSNRDCPLYVLRWNRAHRIETNMEEDDERNNDD